jgi:hypothetical protein
LAVDAEEALQEPDKRWFVEAVLAEALGREDLRRTAARDPPAKKVQVRPIRGHDAPAAPKAPSARVPRSGPLGDKHRGPAERPFRLGPDRVREETRGERELGATLEK